MAATALRNRGADPDLMDDDEQDAMLEEFDKQNRRANTTWMLGLAAALSCAGLAFFYLADRLGPGPEVWHLATSTLRCWAGDAAEPPPHVRHGAAPLWAGPLPHACIPACIPQMSPEQVDWTLPANMGASAAMILVSVALLAHAQGSHRVATLAFLAASGLVALPVMSFWLWVTWTSGALRYLAMALWMPLVATLVWWGLRAITSVERDLGELRAKKYPNPSF
eukprot:gene11057-2007_t